MKSLGAAIVHSRIVAVRPALEAKSAGEERGDKDDDKERSPIVEPQESTCRLVQVGFEIPLHHQLLSSMSFLAFLLPELFGKSESQGCDSWVLL